MRLIDADELKTAFPTCDNSKPVLVASVRATINHMPTIESRKKGKWIKISHAGIYECSVCGQNVMTGDIEVYRFCHGCGADLRGDKNVDE